MAKVLGTLFAMALALSCGNAMAANVTFPVKAADREKVAEMILDDPLLMQTVMRRFAMTRLSGFGEELKAAEERAANMKKGPTGGMEKETPSEPEAKTGAVMDTSPASGMTENTGMAGSKGPVAVGQGFLSASEETPESEPAADISKFPVPMKKKNATVQPSPLPAERVDVFLSLTCPYCGELWKGIRSNAAARSHLSEDRVNIWFIPRSTTEAGVVLVYQVVYDKDPEKAYEFIDYFFDNRASFAGMSDGAVFGKFDEWLRENKLPGITSLQGNSALVQRLGQEIQKGIVFGKTLEVSAFPSIYVDGKEDNDWFAKVDKAASK